MKASEFRKLIREEVRKVLKEEQVAPINIWTAYGTKRLEDLSKKLGGAFANIKFISKTGTAFSTYTAQLDVDKLKAALANNSGIEIGNPKKSSVTIFVDGVMALDLEKLDANTFNALKKLVKPVKQNLNSVSDYVEAIVDMAGSGAGTITGLQSSEFTKIVKNIKANNLMDTVDKALVKYINNTEDSFTEDDIEALQAVGFKMKGINYDNLTP